MNYLKMPLCFLVAGVMILGESVAQDDTTNPPIVAPVQEAVQIRQVTQKAREQWRDDHARLMTRYEQLVSDQNRLAAEHSALQESIQSSRRKIAEKEKQLAHIEEVRTQIEPFLQAGLVRLKAMVDDDLPFLSEERTERIQRLEGLLADPELAISERFRKLMEALLVEAEYGNTIEVYQQTIAVNNAQMLVNIFRLGRISLFYQTLDQTQCGFFDVAANSWQPLEAAHNRAIGAAIDMGAKRKPVELLSLPVGRISVP